MAAEDEILYEEVALKDPSNEVLTESSVELRSIFPENWLFSLESSKSNVSER